MIVCSGSGDERAVHYALEWHLEADGGETKRHWDTLLRGGVAAGCNWLLPRSALIWEARLSSLSPAHKRKRPCLARPPLALETVQQLSPWMTTR